MGFGGILPSPLFPFRKRYSELMFVEFSPHKKDLTHIECYTYIFYQLLQKKYPWMYEYNYNYFDSNNKLTSFRVNFKNKS